MQITSPAFTHGGLIDPRHSCDGDDTSPPLNWQDIPPATKSLAIICDDPDAPMGTWVHWVYFNLPPQIATLPAGITPIPQPPQGGRQGRNDFGRIGYGGPCPPSGSHRYYFKLYALDTILDLDAGSTKRHLVQAMQNHILDKASIMCRYER